MADRDERLKSQGYRKTDKGYYVKPNTPRRNSSAYDFSGDKSLNTDDAGDLMISSMVSGDTKKPNK